MRDFCTIASRELPDETQVVGFRGDEGFSRPYSFEVFLSAPHGGEEIELSDAISARATLTIDLDDGRPPFLFHGIFAELELLHVADTHALLRGLLVPQLWQLSLTLHSRVFTDQSVPDILDHILEEGGLSSGDYALKLAQTYKPHEHVCQYKESDLDFISRWMEREGLYYFFEHGDSKEKLVITDNKSSHDVLTDGPVRFHALAGKDASSKEALHTFTCRQRSLPARVRLKDYDYNKPTVDVSGTQRVSKTGTGEVSIHGNRFFSAGEGKRLAKLRAEELLAREVVFRGTGSALYLRSGCHFELQDHPRGSFDAKYLATGVEHYSNQGARSPELKQLTGLDRDDTYLVEVTAIPEKVQFRAERKTAWPRIYGYENAVIDGPEDTEYAQIDDHGRYAVKLMFDESDLRDGKASTWVRMLQPHGGTIEGWHFPLRKGTEVLLSFLGGDPDRPVIAGAVPTTHTPSPVTRANRTTNVIQTGGRNRIEMEDKKGAQRITIGTPYANTYIRMGSPNADSELIVKTDQNALLDTGRRWDIHVGDIKREVVDGAVYEEYLGDIKKEEVPSGPVVENYTQDHFTTVGAKRTQEYGEQKKLVKGLFEETIGSHKVTIKGGLNETVTGGVNQKYDTLNTFITGGATITSPAGYTVIAPGGIKQVGASWFKMGTHSGEIVGAKLSVLGSEAKIVAGVALSIATGKIDFSGMKMDIGGPWIQLRGTELKTVEAAISRAALQFHASSVFLFL